MRRLRRNLLLASIFVAAPLTMIATLPASAQVSVSIGFDSFHNELAPYGDWVYSDRWGEVWRPMSQDRDRDWRPYWAGHWADTDEYGWTWISDEGSWGDIAYHYGRWVNDPDDGWLWLPGYVWSPAWVVWRNSGENVGWMPMPPDDPFLGRGGISIGVSFGDWNDIGGYYGYSRWYGRDFDENRFGGLWTFVPGGRLSDPGYRRYALARPQTVNIVRQSRNITNYTVVNNTIINRSVSPNVVQAAGGRAPQPVRADTVLRDRRWVAPVNQGEQIQQRVRQERPHGNGQANSAPAPTPQQVQSLSTRAIPVRTQNNASPASQNNANQSNGPNAEPGNRGGGSHLFNRNTVQQFSARQQGQPNAQPNTQPTAQPQSGAPQAQPNAAPGGNDNNRDRRGPGRPENNGPDNRGAQPTPAPPNAAAPNPAAPNPAERNRERPQQQQSVPQAQPQQPQPPQQEERNNRPDRNQERNFQREPQQPAAQAAPERAAPPTPPQREATPTPPTDRGNRPDRNQDRGQDRGQDRNFGRTPPAMEQRAQPERAAPERQAMPERAAPPPPPREAPQRPAVEQRATPPSPPQAQQQREQRPPEAARPNASPDRTPPPDRGSDRNQGRDRSDKPDNRGNDNR